MQKRHRDHTENKLFCNPKKKWLTQLKKGTYGKLPAGGIKKIMLRQVKGEGKKAF